MKKKDVFSTQFNLSSTLVTDLSMADDKADDDPPTGSSGESSDEEGGDRTKTKATKVKARVPSTDALVATITQQVLAALQKKPSLPKGKHAPPLHPCRV